ncbi:MAG: N-acetylglucosamine-6-phosphate deacetylase [Peptococcaceae bacterium]|jgi:N-acetylglucosamine-6-phosphate deacetylase|nr:N-acetylglucosamine-6-phosphate deacetylase [Peptococcaceae bacterium]
MAGYLLYGGLVPGAEGRLENHGVAVTKGKIALIEAGSKPPAGRLIDATGCYICPGFIDLHVHGGSGSDALDGSPEAIRNMASFHARFGTTGMLPTIATAPWERIIDALRAVATAAAHPTGGSRILGVHLEGPYLNPSFKGAQNEEFLRRPDPAELERLAEAAGGWLRLVTLAPELPGALPAVARLSSLGIVAAAGHSGATFEDITSAIPYGLKHVTHTFNAMRPFHHREPGLPGAALALPGLSVEAIADGVHIHPAVLRTLWRLAPDRLTLVTDAVAPAGMPDGDYTFAGQKITVTRGEARLPGGTLAGSTLTMDRAVKNMVESAGLTLFQAVALASTNPARVLGLQHRKGSVKDGYDADLVLMDRNLRPQMVMVEGEIVYTRGNV